MSDDVAADKDAIQQIIELAYEALAFDPGSQPDWVAFNASFYDRAVLALRVFPQDAEVQVLNLKEYAQAQLSKELKEQGYSELPGESTIEVFGDVALVRQHFTMEFVERSVPAIDVFTLARIDGTWRIVSVVSDIV